MKAILETPRTHRLFGWCRNFIAAAGVLLVGSMNAQITVFPACQDFQSGTNCSTATNCTTVCGLPGGWTNLGGAPDWLIDVAGTPSSGTGPGVDHTLGTTVGKYVYIEASSVCTPRVAQSPDYDVSALTNGAEFSVWYHMYGGNIGDFTVEVEDVTNDPGVYVNLINESGNKGNQWNFSGWIDVSAYTGTIRFRVTGTNSSTFAGDMAFDDFCVQAIASCPDPTDQTATNFSPVGADLGWTESGPATAWDLEIGTFGFTPTGTPTVDDVTTNPYTWAGGAATTAYQFYVRADCGMDNTSDISAWVGPFDFTTPCAAEIAPYSEGFDVASANPPTCWSIAADLASDGWEFQGQAGFSTFNCGGSPGSGSTGMGGFAWVDYSGTIDEDNVLLIAPIVDVSALTSPQLAFDRWMCTYQTPNPLFVEYFDGAVWQILASYAAGTSGWEHETLSLSAAVLGNNTVQIRFRAEDTDLTSAQYHDQGLDEISFEEAPTCPDPNTLSASNETTVGADLSWIESGPATAWDLEIGATPYTPTGTITVNDASANPYTWAGGAPSTEYDFYVRADCGMDNTSDISGWVGPFTFTTACAVFPAPFHEGFDVSTFSTPPNCWSIASDVGSGWQFNGPAGFYTSACGSPGNGSSGSGSYAWVDYSSTDELNDRLDMPIVDVSTLTTPQLSFERYMCLPTAHPAHPLFVEYFDGAVWQILASYTTGTATSGSGAAGWQHEEVDLTPAVIGGLVQVRFRAEDGGSTSTNNYDQGIDEVYIIETPPVNDRCSNAIAVACNSLTSGTTLFSTDDSQAISCTSSYDGGQGVWYTLAGWDGDITASTCTGSNFDTKLHVYTGTCGTFSCVAGGDDECATQSSVTWAAASGTTYYILVHGNAGATGDFDLTIVCGNNNNSCTANGLAIEFQTDASPFENTWDLLDGTGSFVVASGGPLAAPGALLQEFACVPDGCYQFRVNDSGGNGMSTGGYVVRTQGTNIRIIDNANNFSSGSVSQSGEAFCLPLGTSELLYSSCDKYFWATGEYIVCNEDAAVAADWNGGGAAGADSGYDFWIFDPNGAYSYVRSRRHNVSDNYANVGSSRTCHMKINNWAAANHIPNGMPLNVRIRPVVNGVAGAYGPACRFTRNEVVANCPPTLLFDVPGFPQFYSCGVQRDFIANTANRLYARPVGGATQYRFTFDNAELMTPIVRVASNYFLTLGWSAAAAPPLVPGQSYDVTVEAFKGGSWCIPGNVCIVTINNMVAGGQQNVALDGQESALNMWPNPNQGDVLNMSLRVADPFINTVSMDIFDLTGKRMIARTVGIQDGFINTTIDIQGALASGMYMVQVTAGDEVFTQRVVIQK